MIHTAELISAITRQEYQVLQEQENKDFYNGKLHIYTLANYGITEIQALKIPYDENNYSYWCILRINLKRIANNGQATTSLYYCTEEEKENLTRNFERFMSTLLPQRANLSQWIVRRIDYTIDIKTPYVKEYITLLQRGNKPPYSHIDNDKQHKREDKKTHFKGGVRYKNKSITVNIYDKYRERQSEENIYNAHLLESCRDILRIEIQCFKEKVRYIKQRRCIPHKTIYPYLRKEIAFKTIYENLKHIAGKGDYYSYAQALKEANGKNLHLETKKKIEWFLFFINRQYKSVWKLKSEWDEREFKTLTSKLRELNINPVTIPRSYKIKKLPNILSLLQENSTDRHPIIGIK